MDWNINGPYAKPSSGPSPASLRTPSSERSLEDVLRGPPLPQRKLGDNRWNRSNNVADMPAARRKLQFGPGEFPQSMEKVEEEEGNDNVQQDSLDKRRVRRETDCDDRMVDMAPPSEPNVPDVDICYESENLRKKREEHSGIGPGGVKRKKKATLEPVTDQDDHGEDDGVFCGEDVANDEEETAQKKKQMKQWRQPRSEEDAGVE